MKIFSRIYSVLSLFFSLLLINSGCSQMNDSFAEITPEQVQAKIKANPDVIVIDVRTPAEFTGELGHIAQAKLHPLQKIEKWEPQFENSKDKEIIMVCRSGNRSGAASRYFKEKGYKNIFNMKGGMRTWNKENLPVKKNSPESGEQNDEK